MKKLLIASTALVAALAASQALAETTFDASVTNANGELLTTLSWNSDRATCVASGHSAWTGPKTRSGMETLPAITLSGSYTLTLTCTSPVNGTALLTWTPPTQNTDGTPLLNLAGYKVYWGTASGTYPNSVTLNNPGLASYTVENLVPGTYFFVVTALNSVNVESMFSNVAMKTVVEVPAEVESVTLTVNPIPEAPSNLSAE